MSAGGASAAGAGSEDCSGTFGAPRTVLARQAPGFSVGSLALGPDELELHWVGGPMQTYGYFRSTRASKAEAFGPATPIPELDAVCNSQTLLRSGDLSLDGLRLYLTCYEPSSSGVSPVSDLRLATRAAIGASWTIDARAYGRVSSSPSLRRDELELFASPEATGQTTLTYTRSAVGDSFGSSVTAGVASITTPDLSPNGLHLYGTMDSSLVVASRSALDALFGGPEPILAADSAADDYFGSATISNDCRSLYYVAVEVLDTDYVMRVDVMTR